MTQLNCFTNFKIEKTVENGSLFTLTFDTALSSYDTRATLDTKPKNVSDFSFDTPVFKHVLRHNGAIFFHYID